jgi:RecJ-like exonuclease
MEGLNSLKPGTIYKGDVKIIKKAKPGPVVFIVTNGIGAIEAVKKDSDFKAGDVVYIEGQVNEHRGRLQIELTKIVESKMDFESIINEKAKPARTTFSIQSDRYEKMKPVMIGIATRIRRAILEGQPIMIRHHCDSDGINSGISIEHACLGLMQDLGIESRYLLFRSPSRAPFYAANDVLRDLVLSKKLLEADGELKPLVIVTDNGSTPSDALGLNTLKILGYEAIVIDHHNPVQIENGVTAVDSFVSHHLNPYKLGLDSKTSAGMLCYEIGRFIWEKLDEPKIPAVAAISDRCDIPETESYIANTGMTREELGKIGTAIDYVSYQLKFDAGRGVYEELYGSQQFVNLINEDVNKGFESQLQSALPYVRSEDMPSLLFSTIDVEKYTMRFAFPGPGLVTSRVHEVVVSENEGKACVTLGCMADMIIIRANKPILPSGKIIETLKVKFPAASVDGGGHEMAAAVRFVGAHREEIIEEIRTMARAIQITGDEVL